VWASLFLTGFFTGASFGATTPTETESAAKELSVAPLDHVVYPSSRPDWVTNPSDADGNPYRVVIVSGPCDTADESLEEMRVLKRAAVSLLVSQIAQSEGRSDFFSLSDEQIDQDIVARQYSGEVTQGDRIRYEHAAEIDFPESYRTRVEQAWQNIEVGRRLGAAGVVTFASVLALIGGSAFTGLLSRRAYRKQTPSDQIPTDAIPS
jgi:hypothetical protein